MANTIIVVMNMCSALWHGMCVSTASACNYGNGCLNDGTCEAFPFCLCPEGVYGDACETGKEKCICTSLLQYYE